MNTLNVAKQITKNRPTYNTVLYHVLSINKTRTLDQNSSITMSNVGENLCFVFLLKMDRLPDDTLSDFFKSDLKNPTPNSETDTRKRRVVKEVY